MTKDTIPNPEQTNEEQTNAVGQSLVPIPAGRPGTSVSLTVLHVLLPLISLTLFAHSAQEIAGAVIYLVSPAGCYTNGQELVVDGGYLCVNPSSG